MLAAQKSGFFAGISQKHVAELLASATKKRVKAKECIYALGAPAKHLFLLRHGRVRLYKTTKRGDEIVFGWLGPGDAFGLGSLVAYPLPYMGTAEALTEVEVLAWTHAKIREYLARFPQIGENALRLVLRYLRAYADRHSRLVTKSAEERLADVLLTLQKQAQVRDNRVELDATNEQLSALADISLFTTSRIMSKWARKGHIKKQRGRVLITAPEALAMNS